MSHNLPNAYTDIIHTVYVRRQKTSQSEPVDIHEELTGSPATHPPIPRSPHLSLYPPHAKPGGALSLKSLGLALLFDTKLTPCSSI